MISKYSKNLYLAYNHFQIYISKLKIIAIAGKSSPLRFLVFELECLAFLGLR